MVYIRLQNLNDASTLWTTRRPVVVGMTGSVCGRGGFRTAAETQEKNANVEGRGVHLPLTGYPQTESKCSLLPIWPSNLLVFLS